MEGEFSTTLKATRPTTGNGAMISSTATAFSTTKALSSSTMSMTFTICAKSRTTGSDTKVNLSLFRLFLLRQ
jgi:hypothetical protein